MENPATWKPIHHAIARVIQKNEQSDLLSYELISELQKSGFLSKKLDEDFVSELDQVIWDHQEATKMGVCGLSLPMKLGKLIEK